MKTIHFSDEYELSVQGSPWALFLYQREFSTGEQKADFYADWAYFTDGIFTTDEEGNLIDREKPRIDAIFLLKAAWAMAKNYDDAIPDFEAWAKDAPISMSMHAPWLMEVQTAILAEIFRHPTDESPEKGGGTSRRRKNSRAANPSS